MAGNKNSGRLPFSEEMTRREVLRKSWAKANDMLDGQQQRPQVANLVQAIVVKTIPDEIKGSVNFTVEVIDYSSAKNS